MTIWAAEGKACGEFLLVYLLIEPDFGARANARNELKRTFLGYNFVGYEIITKFAPEFIPHLRKGNRKTQALKLCVFCFL